MYNIFLDPDSDPIQCDLSYNPDDGKITTSGDDCPFAESVGNPDVTRIMDEPKLGCLAISSSPLPYCPVGEHGIPEDEAEEEVFTPMIP